MVASCVHASSPGMCGHELHPYRRLVLDCLEAASGADLAKVAQEADDPASAVRGARVALVERVLAGA